MRGLVLGAAAAALSFGIGHVSSRDPLPADAFEVALDFANDASRVAALDDCRRFVQCRVVSEPDEHFIVSDTAVLEMVFHRCHTMQNCRITRIGPNRIGPY